jgi:hypothetical protein
MSDRPAREGRGRLSERTLGGLPPNLEKINLIRISCAVSSLLPTTRRQERTSSAIPAAEGILRSLRDRLCQQATGGAREASRPTSRSRQSVCGSRPARVASSAHTATVAHAIERAFGTCEVLIAQRESTLAGVGTPHLPSVLRPRIAIGASGMASSRRVFGGEPTVMVLSRTQSATGRQVARFA